MKTYKQLTIFHDGWESVRLVPSDTSDDLLMSLYNTERELYHLSRVEEGEFDCSYKIKMVSYKKRKPPKWKVIVRDVQAWIDWRNKKYIHTP